MWTTIQRIVITYALGTIHSLILQCFANIVVVLALVIYRARSLGKLFAGSCFRRGYREIIGRAYAQFIVPEISKLLVNFEKPRC